MFRFEKYEVRYVEDGRILACPICRPGYDIEFSTTNDLSGADILVSLYNRALKINDFSEEKPYDELIIDMLPDFRLRLKVNLKKIVWFLQPMSTQYLILLGSHLRRNYAKIRYQS